MKRNFAILLLLGLAFPLRPVQASQANPLDINIRNLNLHRLGATENLESDFAALVERIETPAWAGYAVPMVEGKRTICCNCGDCGWGGECRLEGSNENYNSSDEEWFASETLAVLYRIDEKGVGKIRSFSGNCELDAGGKDVYWWSDVDPEQSLDLLKAQVNRRRSNRLAERGIMAIAHHRQSAADSLLEGFADDEQPEAVAEKAIFWMGAARGESGFESLMRIEKSVRDDDLREQIVFALYLSKAEGATSELIRMARQDGDKEVRERALFWLGQKAGLEASRAIQEAIDEDPERDVKKKAVFALSQLPPDEGIPMLIDVAKTHRDPAIRKQAMFWLGQSGDPRALDLFEEILLKK
jgi:hypothetical protein